MPEAEELLIDAARHTIEGVRAFWTRHRAPQPAQALLDDHRHRLALLVEAVLGSALPVRAAQAEAPASRLQRFLRGGPAPAAGHRALPATDGQAIHLPPALPRAEPYALLALLQGLRCLRGSAAAFAHCRSDLARELFLLAEAAACNEALRRLMPGWRARLDTLCLEAWRDAHPAAPGGTLASTVGALHAALLTGAGGAPPLLGDAARSLDWADARAARLQARHPRERYRPWLGDLVVGRLLPLDAAPSALGRATRPAAGEEAAATRAALSRRPRVRPAGEDEDDARPGPWVMQTSVPQEHAEDPLGLQRPEDGRPEDGAGAAQSLAELERARLVSTPGRAREVFYGPDPPPRAAPPEGPVSHEAPGLRYPEWDTALGRYRRNAVRVRARCAPEGDPAWVEAALRRHAGLLAEVKRRLGSLRPGRERLRRRQDGDELDCDALVAERIERRAGRAPAGAVYQGLRAAPRRVGLLLLLDASGSTDGWIADGARVIDVEKDAALVAATALEAARFTFAVMAFSGEGPEGVEIATVKDFAEPWDRGTMRRLAGLDADRYTRLGAAVRHANAQLADLAVHHRLLLLLSDGRPNDCDRYAARHGLEDARQALVESRLAHIDPYCLTVDRSASTYLPRLFGDGRYAIVQRADQLPQAFVEWLRRAARRCLA